jgi:hypothetical protein
VAKKSKDDYVTKAYPNEYAGLETKARRSAAAVACGLTTLTRPPPATERKWFCSLPFVTPWSGAGGYFR